MSGDGAETGRWHWPSLQGRGPESRKPHAHSVPHKPGGARGSPSPDKPVTPEAPGPALPRLGTGPASVRSNVLPKHGPEAGPGVSWGQDSGKETSPAAGWEPPLPRLQTGWLALPSTRRLDEEGLHLLSSSSSGFLPGVCGVAVGYPLDTVKVCGDRPCPPAPSPCLIALRASCISSGFSPHPALPPTSDSLTLFSGLCLRFLLSYGAH